MANKPLIRTLAPIDATKSFGISASYSGDLPYSNRLRIYNAESLAVVYDNTVTSHAIDPFQTIPANTLTNGNRYAAEVTFYDNNGVPSDTSDKSYFVTLETPSFYVDEYSTVGINTLKSAVLTLTLIYGQEESEKLYNFQFFLYNSEHKKIDSSDMFYDIATESTYSFRGLSNRTTYYAKVIGTTDHGMKCETPYIQFFTDFANPNTYGTIYAESDKNGTVNGYTNVVIIQPTDTDPSHFEFDKGYINLEDKELVYQDNINIDGDFTMSIKVKNLVKDVDLLEASGEIYGFVISAISYDDNKFVFKLNAPNAISSYILYSDILDVTPTDIVLIHIRRINDVFVMIVEVHDATYDDKAFWFGTLSPSVDVNKYETWINIDGTPTEKVEPTEVIVYYQNVEPTNGASATQSTSGGDKTIDVVALNEYNIWIADKEDEE